MGDKSSKYKNVSVNRPPGAKCDYYKAKVVRNKEEILNASFKSERDAAIEVDKALIRIGEDPINILKRVK